MKVKELIENLKQLDQEAIVCAEVYDNPVIKEVKQFQSKDKQKYVYIGDDLENLFEEWRDNEDAEED